MTGLIVVSGRSVTEMTVFVLLPHTTVPLGLLLRLVSGYLDGMMCAGALLLKLFFHLVIVRSA